MKFQTYNLLKEELDRLLGLEEYRKAITLLENAQENLPEKEYQEYYFDIVFNKARYYTNCQMYEHCMDSLKDLVDKGFICPLDWQRFEPLKQDARYLELEERNNLLKEQAQKEAQFDYVVYTPTSYTRDRKYPVFFILHGDGGNIKELSSNWKPNLLLKEGFLVVYPQSSQVLYHNNFGWLGNPLIAREEIKSCWGLLQQQYSINADCVLLGGFSGGAITALDVTLADIIPVRGFVAICPVLKPKAFTKQNVELAAARGVKGVFMEGAEELPVAAEDEMLKMFKRVGLPYKYVINKGTGHWFPDDLDNKLGQSVKFILG